MSLISTVSVSVKIFLGFRFGKYFVVIVVYNIIPQKLSIEQNMYGTLIIA